MIYSRAADAAVGGIDEPSAEQVSGRVDAVSPEPAECRIAGLKPNVKALHILLLLIPCGGGKANEGILEEH
jgi:hypothetical protein